MRGRQVEADNITFGECSEPHGTGHVGWGAGCVPDLWLVDWHATPPQLAQSAGCVDEITWSCRTPMAMHHSSSRSHTLSLRGGKRAECTQSHAAMQPMQFSTAQRHGHTVLGVGRVGCQAAAQCRGEELESGAQLPASQPASHAHPPALQPPRRPPASPAVDNAAVAVLPVRADLPHPEPLRHAGPAIPRQP